jgi:hypothetical protein
MTWLEVAMDTTWVGSFLWCDFERCAHIVRNGYIRELTRTNHQPSTQRAIHTVTENAQGRTFELFRMLAIFL